MKTRKAGKFCGTRIGFRRGIIPFLVACDLAVMLPPASGQFALTAVSTINLKGNNVTVDSFNSQDPLHSDWQTNLFYHGSNYGFYPLSEPGSKREANAVVATDSNIINVAEAVIYGYVLTAPGSTVSIIQNGSVGDTDWVGPDPINPRNYGIQWGHAGDNMNVVFPDVSLPSVSWTLLAPSPSTNIGGMLYQYVITNSGNYEISSMLTAGLYVAATNVTLYLPNGLHLSSGCALTVGTNADLIIYSGDSISTSGSAFLNNLNQLALTFGIYGLPPGVDSAGDNVNGCISVSLSGNGLGTGYLYAPQASFSFYGGGASTYDVVGAYTAHDIQLNGHYSFHYDESLAPRMRPWVIGQPTNCNEAMDSNATFTVSAISPSLNYRWLLNQTNLISNAFQPSLSLTKVQLSDAGNYSVIVTNLYGSVTSAPASLVVYTNATPTLSIDSGATDGRFQFDISGVTGLNYIVQASTNLIDWVPVKTNISPFTFVDTNTTLYPQRFYRSVFTQ